MQTKNTSYNCCVFENVWKILPTQQRHETCFFHTQTFNPSIIARMAGFRSLNQSSPKVNPQITKPFYCKKGWGAQEAPQKNRRFWYNFADLKSPRELKKKMGRFVANAVTCAVLLVDVVGLLVLQNHAENLSFVVNAAAAFSVFRVGGFVSNS